MQSTTFRLLSLAVTLILLLGLAILVTWVLQQDHLVPKNPNTLGELGTPLATDAMVGQLSAEQPGQQPTPVTSPGFSAAEPLTATTSVSPTSQSPSSAIPSISSVSESSVPVSSIAASSQSDRTVATSAPAILRPTPTPTPITAMQPPVVFADSPASGWFAYSNGNQVYDVAVLDTTLWAATGGGVVAWNRDTNAATKFTNIDGLITNQITAVVNCPIADFGLIFGTAYGLQIYDAGQRTWRLQNSRNSGMRADDISTLDCHAEQGLLVVGYRENGVDIFDEAVGTWRRINQSSGLRSDRVEGVAVVGDLDALWVTSSSGISVLTADTVRVYDSTNSPLDTDQINVIAGDVDGTVWLGTHEKVYAISGEEWTIYSPAYLLASRFPAGEIVSFAFTNNGTLWIGSERGELCLFDPVAVHCNQFFTAADLEIATAITSLTVDAEGYLYVATRGEGVRFYDGERWRAFALPHNLFGNQPRAMTQDVTGYLWVTTEMGLEQLNPTLLEPLLLDPLLDTTAPQRIRLFPTDRVDFSLNTVQALIADPQAGFWIAGEGAGYFDGQQWRRFTTADGLVDRGVQALAIDGDRRIWLGTQAGLSIWNGSTFFNLTSADGLPDNVVTALLGDGDRVWIGTNAGLLRFSENRLQIYNSANSGLPDDRIQSLAKLSEETLLIGTARGLARLTDTTVDVVPELAAESIRSIGVLSDGTIWLVSAENGLAHFDGARWGVPANAIRPPAATIAFLFVDQQDTLWIGGDGGLLRYVP